MKILFEEYSYPTESVRGIVGDFLLTEPDRAKSQQKLQCVGYFFNSRIANRDGSRGDLVFILPKVLIDSDNKAFGAKPEQLINFSPADWKSSDVQISESGLSKRQVYDFIYKFATWIYRAVSIYRGSQKRNGGDNDDAEVMTSLQLGRSSRQTDATYMDILLSLIDFERQHRGFITYTIKMAHSGFNKISWTRTMARTQAVVQDGGPVYLSPVNKKKIVDFDEELLIIYYSILNYIHTEYGFPIPGQPGYKLIKGAQFRSYLKSQGKTRLHKIRYKYYSDEAVLLWNLCYAFFCAADRVSAKTSRRDFLLVSKFETVFEAMIDELVGDKNLPDGLKTHSDDKRIDHLYTYKYLLENMDGAPLPGTEPEIYNIADSKYYKRGRGLSGHDVPKQFTYARNVIQWHMDLLHELIGDSKSSRYKAVKLFDPLTEGYNIIPNFFISAQVDDTLSYEPDNLRQSELGGGKHVHESFIFWERLFDRNTYFTLHYDVNFLYILRLYAQNRSGDKSRWREQVRSKFRQHILEHLNKEFHFWQIMVHETAMEDFVDRHYRKIIGKVFAFRDMDGNHVLLYAERKNQNNGHGKSYEHSNETHAHIENGMLVIPGRGRSAIYKASPISLAESRYAPTGGQRPEYAIVGYYKDQAHLDWITKNGIYNMRSVMRGKVRPDDPKFCATLLVLHNGEHGNHVFRITSPTLCKARREQLPQGDYVPSQSEYFIYDIDNIDATTNDYVFLEKLIKSKCFINKLKQKRPVSISMDKLREMSRAISIDEFTYRIEKEDIFLSVVAEDAPVYGRSV